MDYFRNFYGNPNQFGNWQQYAGMDPNKSFMGDSGGASVPATAGVAPPSSFAEMGQQLVDKAQSKISGLGTNISNATQQFSQGNILSGFQAAQGGVIPGAAPPSAPKPPMAPSVTPTVVDDYDYTSRVGQ